MFKHSIVVIMIAVSICLNMACTKTSIVASPKSYIGFVNAFPSALYSHQLKTSDSSNYTFSGNPFVLKYDSVSAGVTRWKIKAASTGTFTTDTTIKLETGNFSTVLTDSNGIYATILNESIIAPPSGYCKVRLVILNSDNVTMPIYVRLSGNPVIWNFDNRTIGDIKINTNLSNFTTIPSGSYAISATKQGVVVPEILQVLHNSNNPQSFESGGIYTLVVKAKTTLTPASIMSFVIQHKY